MALKRLFQKSASQPRRLCASRVLARSHDHDDTQFLLPVGPASISILPDKSLSEISPSDDLTLHPQIPVPVFTSKLSFEQNPITSKEQSMSVFKSAN
jgi:hypothetical protein